MIKRPRVTEKQARAIVRGTTGMANAIRMEPVYK
jgi:hypothetical protein